MTHNNRGPEYWAGAVTGLIVILVKTAASLVFLWMCFLFGIIGVECVRTGEEIMKHGLVNLPRAYYEAAFYFTMCALGLMYSIRRAFANDMFSAKGKEDEPAERKEDDKR